MTKQQRWVERKLFELWCAKQGYSTTRQIDTRYDPEDEGHYFLGQTEDRWQGWLASVEHHDDQ